MGTITLHTKSIDLSDGLDVLVSVLARDEGGILGKHESLSD